MNGMSQKNPCYRCAQSAVPQKKSYDSADFGEHMCTSIKASVEVNGVQMVPAGCSNTALADARQTQYYA